MRRAVVGMLVLGVCAFSALGQRTLREYGRLRGQDEYRLTGLGLVVGLNGTGDSGDELVVARPLAEALRALGNPIPDFSELENSQSVALVMVTATVPRAGMEVGDKLDIEVSVMHSAESLEGGMLLTCPLVSPVVRDTAFALAHGRISLVPGGTPTVGSISGGADAIQRVSNLPALNGSFEVILDANIAGWDVASGVATEINQQYLLSGSTGAEPLADVVDPRTIRVRIPTAEGARPAPFVGDVLSTDISSALRKLEARVICDTRNGVILLTGDVRVSPAVITHKDLTITTTVPPPVPSEQNPQVQRNRWAAVNTEPASPDTARLEDLIAAFDQLDVGARDQIQILEMLHKAGKLHARLIVDGTRPLTPPQIGNSFSVSGSLWDRGLASGGLGGRSLESQRSFEDVMGVVRDSDRIEGEGRSREAAEKLVARALLEPLLARARESGWAAEPFAPTRAEKQFRGLVDAQVAEEVVRRGNFEIVNRIAETLERSGGGQ